MCFSLGESALLISITSSLAIFQDPPSVGRSTGVKTPELLKEELSGYQNTCEESYGVVLDSDLLPCCAAFSDTGS